MRTASSPNGSNPFFRFLFFRGVGVFAEDIENTDIPVEVWRYYLLVNRPE